MTAIRAAFEKAGVNTARLELEQQVKELLAKNKNKPTGIIVGFDHLILRRRDLREVLLLDYAIRIAGNGQIPNGAQSGTSDSGNAVGHAPIDAQSGSADCAPGQLDHDIQKASAGGTYKREPVYHVPSPAQKAAARQVMAESLGIWSRKIGDRPIGELTWGELEALRRDSIRHAGKSVETGISRAADGILIGKILLYARVKDMTTLVKDVVPGEVLQRLNHEAAKEAPVVVDIGRIVYERELTNQIEHRA